MTAQLAFELVHRAARGRADFFAAPSNAAALAAVEGWRGWPGGRLVLAGPEGSGKSHLVQIWAEAAGAAVVPAERLAGAALTALAEGGRVAIEDAHRLGGSAAAERAALHLANLLAEGAGHLMLAGRGAPRDWGIALPDLASRIAAAPQVRLEPPDDALLAAVLVKLLSDRQIAPDPDLVPWIVARMHRSLAAAGAVVAALDARSLARGRPVGRALAAEVLEELAEGMADAR